jgi:hypothetical protein
MVGGADDDRRLGKSESFDGVQERTDGAVERFHASLETGGVVPGFRDIGQGGKGLDIAAGRFENIWERTMGFERPGIEEEGLLTFLFGSLLQPAHGVVHDRGGMEIGSLQNGRVPERGWVFVSDVLEAGQDGFVPGAGEDGGEMLLWVSELEPAVRESEHAGVVRRLTGEQGCTTGRAGGRGGVGLVEEDAVLGEALDVWGLDREAKWAGKPADIVAVDVDNVWLGDSQRWLLVSSLDCTRAGDDARPGKTGPRVACASEL